MEAVTLGLAKGATFPATITGVGCDALTDTGVSHKSMSENF